MLYRQHRSHLRYATVAGPARRYHRRLGPEHRRPFSTPEKRRAGRSDALRGLLHGLPLGIALWLAMILLVRAFV